MKSLAVLFLISVSLTYANDQSNVYDLKKILTTARKNNPALQLTAEKLNQIDYQKSLTISNLYPTVGWTLGSTYEKDAVYTGTPKFGGDRYNLYNSDLKLNQTLYAYGSLSAVKQSDYDRKIQALNLEIQQRSLDQSVIEAFYRFVLNQHILENLTKSQDIIHKSLATANDRYRTGRGQLLDVLQVKTQLALLSPQIDQAKNQLDIAGNQLSYYMGETDHSNFQLKGKLKSLYLNEIQKHIDLKNFHLPEYDVNHLQIESLDLTRDITLGKEYPTVKLVGDYLYNNYKKSELFSDYSHSWAIQLQLNIPLFSGLSSTFEKQIISSQAVQLYRAKKDLENALNLNQVSSLRNLQTAETSLVSAQQAVDLAEASQKEASRNYRLATIDFLQFLSVEQAALQARTTLDQLKYQSIVAYSNYFAASGQSLSILVDILNDEGLK